MEEQLISFKTAKLAKEKGFNVETKEYYNNSTKVTSKSYSDYSAPTQSLLQKWLREIYKLDITVITNWLKNGKRVYYVGFSYVKENKIEIWFSKKSGNKVEYPTYENALEKGLFEALKLIKL